MSEKRWNVIYPIYISSKKTIAEGRRVPATIAVDNPTAVEIADVCRYLGFEVVVEVNIIALIFWKDGESLLI